jgi:hypothetical protein
MLTEGGDRESARMLWRQIREGADNDALRNIADLRLVQLDAMDTIDALDVTLRRFEALARRRPGSWRELIDAQLLPGVPLDPTGAPFDFDADRATARVARHSPLWPMPQGFAARRR